MKILSTCQLCRLGILTKAPLCFECGSPLACALGYIIQSPKNLNKELPL